LDEPGHAETDRIRISPQREMNVQLKPQDGPFQTLAVASINGRSGEAALQRECSLGRQLWAVLIAAPVPLLQTVPAAGRYGG
jgi:hypothetical protein